MTYPAARGSLVKALGRGLSMKCPSCGGGRLFARFLKVARDCPACGAELYHHQADDYPAYIVVALVGHFLFSGVLAVELAFAPPVWVHYALWFPLTLIGVLGLLQPVKGAVVAFQWHLGLHGFETARR
ncbi:MAG: DUF983 domain-containing protein [Rhodospirillaceae bacterium]